MDTDPTARALTLLGLLQSRPAWPVAELAARLDTPRRTLRRDVDRLRRLGYRVQGRPGPGSSYRLAPGAEIPPLLFTRAEVDAVVVGLRLVERLLDDGAAPTALAKLAQVLPSSLARSAAATDAATDVLTQAGAAAAEGPVAVAGAVVGAVADTIAEDGRLRFGYVDQHGRRSSRTVDPHRQVLRAGRWSLVGWDLDRDGWRLFRLDRVTDLDRVPGTYRRRAFPAGGVEEWLATDFGRRPRTGRPAAGAAHPRVRSSADVDTSPDGLAVPHPEDGGGAAG